MSLVEDVTQIEIQAVTEQQRVLLGVRIDCIGPYAVDDQVEGRALCLALTDVEVIGAVL